MKQKFSTRVLAEVAIFAAIAVALDILQSGIWRGVWINGGSIGLAMIPVCIIAYRRGFVPGLICGIIVSILQMLGGVYAISDTWYKVFAQIALDYILAYPLVAMCGIFARPFADSQKSFGKQVLFISLGVAIGGLLKFASHFLAGVLFWPATEWNGVNLTNATIYSFVYNGTFCIPNIIIAIAVLIAIAKIAPQILYVNAKVESEEKEESTEELVKEEA